MYQHIGLLSKQPNLGMPETSKSAPTLIVEAGALLCALPVSYAIETMHPLPTYPLSDAKPYVFGVAMIRGEPIHVYDLGHAITGRKSEAISRLITVRISNRIIALAVERVLKIATLPIQWRPIESVQLNLNNSTQPLVQSMSKWDNRLIALLHLEALIEKPATEKKAVA